MKKKRLPAIIAFAAVSLIGILWVTTPVAARLSCSLRIYCASAAAEEDAVDYVTYDNDRLVFANKESLQFLSKMALEGELEDVTGCSLAPWPIPTYYIDDWEIGGNNCLSYHHFGRLYIITPKNYDAEEHFQELIGNAMMFFEDESGQILELQPCMADRVEILHETGDEAQDTTVTVTDGKIISELKAMYDTLQTEVTSRPMAEDRFVLTFYQGDRLIWTWRIAPWKDDGWVITSSSLEGGNYRVTNGFDFDRLAELSKGQQIEARDGAVLFPYAVNTAGQTYGSALSARSHKERPDLISAVGSHGTVGYIYSSDLDAGEPITPSEALTQQTRIEELIEGCDGEEIIVFRTIPLYDVDGITILDEYNISFTSTDGF